MAASGKPGIKRIFMVGATGTIGRATLKALKERGHDIVVFVRPSSIKNLEQFSGLDARVGDVTDPASIVNDGFCGEKFDVILSCLASRNGEAEDAWKIDYQAHIDLLAAAKSAGVRQMVLLSAICVQRPRLAFQQAKLAFEKALIESGMAYSIVRPTAFFKSLSGQVERIQKGKPFLLFGDGELTACKPISDSDLANFIADCIDNPKLQNRILPIGGPGDAITPKQQGEMLFALSGETPKFRHVPVKLLDIIVGCLAFFGRIIPAAARKAELARIGRYYATESMLVWNVDAKAYDAAATPSTGTDTIHDHYKSLIEGKTASERGDHSVF
jgi:divinyl chlorophyllide a 8-vinyl-reductase